LNSLHKKNRVPVWTTVKEAAVKNCGSAVLESDIDIILEIDPDAYLLSWQLIAGSRSTFSLLVNLPAGSLGKLETRLKHFRYFKGRRMIANLCILSTNLHKCCINREKLDDWCGIHPGDHPIAVVTTHIPAKPDTSSTVVNDLKCSISSVSAVASLALERRNALELFNNNLGTNGKLDLESLRDRAIQRDLNKATRESEQLRDRKELEMRSHCQVYATH
jgi:hypothetical protein